MRLPVFVCFLSLCLIACAPSALDPLAEAKSLVRDSVRCEVIAPRTPSWFETHLKAFVPSKAEIRFHEAPAEVRREMIFVTDSNSILRVLLPGQATSFTIVEDPDAMKEYLDILLGLLPPVEGATGSSQDSLTFSPPPSP